MENKNGQFEVILKNSHYAQIKNSENSGNLQVEGACF